MTSTAPASLHALREIARALTRTLDRASAIARVVELLEDEPGGGDGAREPRGVDEVEFDAVRCQQAARLHRLR